MTIASVVISKQFAGRPSGPEVAVAAVDLRPLSLGEVLDRTFTLYRSHFWLFVGIMALPQLILLAVNLLQVGIAGLGRTTTPQNPPVAVATPGAGTILGVLLVFVVAAVGFVAVYVLAQAATVFAVSEIYLGRPASIRQAYGRVRGKVWRLIALVLMIGLAAFAGLLLLIIPGILVWLSTALAVPAAVLEDRTARGALGRSVELTKGNRGRIFLVWLLFFILQWLAIVVFAFPFAIAQEIFSRQGQPSQVLLALSQVGSSLAAVLVGPLATIAFSLLYYDVRIRKEAFDLQVMMSSLGPATPSGIPPAVTGA